MWTNRPSQPFPPQNLRRLAFEELTPDQETSHSFIVGKIVRIWPSQERGKNSAHKKLELSIDDDQDDKKLTVYLMNNFAKEVENVTIGDELAITDFKIEKLVSTSVPYVYDVVLSLDSDDFFDEPCVAKLWLRKGIHELSEDDDTSSVMTSPEKISSEEKVAQAVTYEPNEQWHQRATSSRTKQVRRYNYVSLKDACSSTQNEKNNIFGLVLECKMKTSEVSGNPYLEVILADETLERIAVFIHGKTSDVFPEVYPFDIMRVHRMKVECYRNSACGKCFSPRDIMVFDGKSEQFDYRSTARECTVDPKDREKVLQLYNWGKTLPFATKTISQLQVNQYADLICEVIEVVLVDEEGNISAILVVWDGTKPARNLKKFHFPMERERSDYMEAIKDYVFHIWAYDCHAQSANNLQVDENESFPVVKFQNVHLYIPKHGNETDPQLCLHMGTSRGRGIHILNDERTKCFKEKLNRILCTKPENPEDLSIDISNNIEEDIDDPEAPKETELSLGSPSSVLTIDRAIVPPISPNNQIPEVNLEIEQPMGSPSSVQTFDRAVTPPISPSKQLPIENIELEQSPSSFQTFDILPISPNKQSAEDNLETEQPMGSPSSVQTFDTAITSPISPNKQMHEDNLEKQQPMGSPSSVQTFDTIIAPISPNNQIPEDNLETDQPMGSPTSVHTFDTAIAPPISPNNQIPKDDQETEQPMGLPSSVQTFDTAITSPISPNKQMREDNLEKQQPMGSPPSVQTCDTIIAPPISPNKQIPEDNLETEQPMGSSTSVHTFDTAIAPPISPNNQETEQPTGSPFSVQTFGTAITPPISSNQQRPVENLEPEQSPSSVQTFYTAISPPISPSKQVPVEDLAVTDVFGDIPVEITPLKEIAASMREGTYRVMAAVAELVPRSLAFQKMIYLHCPICLFTSSWLNFGREPLFRGVCFPRFLCVMCDRRKKIAKDKTTEIPHLKPFLKFKFLLKDNDGILKVILSHNDAIEFFNGVTPTDLWLGRYEGSMDSLKKEVRRFYSCGTVEDGEYDASRIPLLDCCVSSTEHKGKMVYRITNTRLKTAEILN